MRLLNYEESAEDTRIFKISNPALTTVIGITSKHDHCLHFTLNSQKVHHVVAEKLESTFSRELPAQ